jgi:hypothetical protein
MKILAVLLLSLFLTACQSIKPWPDFPPAEESLMKECKDLNRLSESESVSITQLMESVVNNYALYHQCANKVSNWQSWYTKQKQVYDDAKKKSNK